MKSTLKIKNLIFLGFIIFFSSIIVLNNEHLSDRIECEIKENTDLNSPRESGFYFESFIHIDGNWSAATGKGWFKGAGLFGNPYIIENVSIDASSSPTRSGIFINNSKTIYFIIRNCVVYNAGSDYYDAGIKLEDSNRGTLTNNNCSENSYNGILLYNECDNNTISGNTINNNANFGIQLYLGCNNTIISGNTANNNGDYGIELVERCDDNIISGNTANSNDDEGIDLQQKCKNNKISGNTASNNIYFGIELYGGCDNNIISGNTANDNGDYGIALWGNCANNTISGNIINDNEGDGIYIMDNCNYNNFFENIIYNNSNNGILTDGAACLYNLFYNNCIFNNSISNRLDNYAPNYWDNGVIGNYWGDYKGIDANYDGIGDTPYSVPGTGSNQDEKPIMNYNPFFWKPPEDLCYEVETKGHNLRWTVITTTPLINFKILRDGALVKTGKLFTFLNEIELNVDNLDEGVYWYLIEINDRNGKTFVDGMWINVISTISVPQPSITYIIDDSESTTKEIISDDSTLIAALIITVGIIAAALIIYIFLMRKRNGEVATKISKLRIKNNKGHSKVKERQ